ncbi:MAG: hypothetical protein HY657_18245 [Acidobacteria bacterium]|nr:hypothetical protein [Acidobacteriota bacterium]
MVRRVRVGGGLSLTSMADRAPKSIRGVSPQPRTRMRGERLRRAREGRVVHAQMARRAAIDAIEIRQPDLLDSAHRRCQAERVGILHSPFEPPELRLDGAPLGQVLLEEHPGKNRQKRDAQDGECLVQAER